MVLILKNTVNVVPCLYGIFHSAFQRGAESWRNHILRVQGRHVYVFVISDTAWI